MVIVMGTGTVMDTDMGMAISIRMNTKTNIKRGRASNQKANLTTTRREMLISMLYPISYNIGRHFERSNIFLHVLGDALGSIGAIISGIIIKFAHNDAKYYADPILSIVLALIVSFRGFSPFTFI